MTTDELWSVARDVMSIEQQEQLNALNEIQQERTPSIAEQERLDGLRTEYGRLTLRKARAYALLSLRSGIPLLVNS